MISTRMSLLPCPSRLMQARGAANAKAKAKKDLGWTPRYPTWREGFRTIEA